MARWVNIKAIVFFGALLWISSAKSQINVPVPDFEKVDVVEHLGQTLPREAQFVDQNGTTVQLGDLFREHKASVLVFAYHTCPMLCTFVLDAVNKGLRGIPWSVGEQFDVIVISIDPQDTPALASQKREQVLFSYGSRGKQEGWHFLVGDETNIHRVSDAAGFYFRYDSEQKQYAHPAAAFLLTPEGKIARYLYGIEYKPTDLRIGLLEASEGRSISTVEKLLLYCYHYDPKGSHYALVALNVMKLGGCVTVVLLGGMLGFFWIKEMRASARTK
ncbi:SCO family protein [Pajaroellobacter abortibovis]|uniref:Thioredoxin domain-containing protein n=1 Tax=Pajaroellobacter abortibovis TaxID=1882918 RepID=A0A1L6MVL3_9BACT|nr:SCO family protein [Pajaroellobacter abortibovis]APR99445.1 hypothetical protein BCY86_01170 [Pajaroellobacter abortibovis]